LQPEKDVAMAKEHRAVLVVDDDLDLLSMMESLLGGEGHLVVTARDGEQACRRSPRECRTSSCWT